MTTATEMIEKNNQLRKELNRENEKFYSDFLIYTRLASFHKDEQRIESMLLDILEDILDAQTENVCAADYFGKSPKAVADEILQQVPTNWKAFWKFVLGTVLIYFVMSLLPSLLSLDGKLDVGSLIIGSIYGVCAIILGLRGIAGMIYYTSTSKLPKILTYLVYGVVATVWLLPLFLIHYFIQTPLIVSTNSLLGSIGILLVLCAFGVWWFRSRKKLDYFPTFFAAVVFGAFALIMRIPAVHDWIGTSPIGKYSLAGCLIVALFAYYLVHFLVFKSIEKNEES